MNKTLTAALLFLSASLLFLSASVQAKTAAIYECNGHELLIYEPYLGVLHLKIPDIELTAEYIVSSAKGNIHIHLFLDLYSNNVVKFIIVEGESLTLEHHGELLCYIGRLKAD